MQNDLTASQAVELMQSRYGVRVSQHHLRSWRRHGILRHGQRVYLTGRRVGGHFRYAEADLALFCGAETPPATT